jgi:ABC-2 type transport system permease protein
VIYLVVWSAVARSRGGQVGDFAPGDFAAYYLLAMMVNHLTFTWIMHEFEYRIRQGQFSPKLLRPIHPIHADIADNIAYKLLTLVVMVPAAVVLAVLFRPTLNSPPWALAAFVLALFLAFVVRFVTGWTLALAAFWTTRVNAVNQLYFIALIFFSGQMAPLSLMPEPVQVVASVLPFRWMVSFPVELAMGRLSPEEALVGFGAQLAWSAASLALMALLWRTALRRYTAVGA